MSVINICVTYLKDTPPSLRSPLYVLLGMKAMPRSRDAIPRITGTVTPSLDSRAHFLCRQSAISQGGHKTPTSPAPCRGESVFMTAGYRRESPL
ncbi:hypothetical protein CEXT_204111 [Caerostris extrusa]|uniref:Uncharacterized protein n=1 Tax=Caerostris extrusa TaxID=172846 RepID=A0AAV4PRW4_CAEEX|nr:hypothetical protein CEXT_204111 [Caerostris extrusa]